MAHVTLEHKNLRAALIVVSRRVRVLLALVFRRARVAAARQRRPLRVRAVVPARCHIAEQSVEGANTTLFGSEFCAEALRGIPSRRCKGVASMAYRGRDRLQSGSQ